MTDYVHGGYRDRWLTIGLGVMATQASAITFLSMPGQAYEDGMRFLQFYFGLPIAMVILSVAFIPRFYRLRVLTAYEYLEGRFDLKTRQLAAFLFLLQRGLSAGITIYAPAIVLSKVLGWPLNLTCVVIGGLVILYTVAGGTRAVSQTQKHQMVVMLGGMVVAFVVIVHRLPADLSFRHAVSLAGTLGKMNVVDFSPEARESLHLLVGPDGRRLPGDGLLRDRPVAGAALSLGEVGDREPAGAPVQWPPQGPDAVPDPLRRGDGLRLLSIQRSRRSSSTSRSWRASPRRRTRRRCRRWRSSTGSRSPRSASRCHAWRRRSTPATRAAIADARARVRAAAAGTEAIREKTRTLIAAAVPRPEIHDGDYVFLSFVMANLPRGLIGLLLAVILCAAMSSTASELTALGGCTVVDFYRRSFRKEATDAHYLRVAKIATGVWGLLAVAFAGFASLVDNLIQAVNILGSLFYGTILGIFLAAFFFRRLRATPVFVAAIVSEVLVVGLWLATKIGFLWFNVIGCGAVLILSSLLSGSDFGRDSTQTMELSP